MNKSLISSRIKNWVFHNKAHGKKTLVREIIEIIVLIVVVVIPFRIYVAQPYLVSGVSMSSTFETGHYMLINKFWHKLSAVERGDVLVFKSPTENKIYIKRAIALPGEHIEINNSQVTITTQSGDSFVLAEPYAMGPTRATINTQLSDSQYFVMGDNRNHSYDSRAWGPLDHSFIRGEPFVRLFPFTQIHGMPGRNSIY